MDILRAEVERKIANRRVVAQQPVHTPGIDNRDSSIKDRFEEGVRSGRITKREARMMDRREREFERREASFTADGVVTQEERRQLRKELTAMRDDVERMISRDRRGR